MTNYDINPIEAVEALLQLLEANDYQDIQIQPDSAVEKQIKLVVSLPEVQGLIGYDEKNHVLYVIDGLN